MSVQVLINSPEFYAEPGELKIALNVYESMFNECLKHLGAKFTLRDILSQYDHFRPKFDKTVLAKMTVVELTAFKQVFHFSSNTDSLELMRKQLQSFVKLYPEFMSTSPFTIYHKMLAAIRVFKKQYGIRYEDKVYVNDMMMYGGTIKFQQVQPIEIPEEPPQETPIEDEEYLKQLTEFLE